MTSASNLLRPHSATGKGLWRAALFFTLLLVPLGLGECYIRSLPNVSKAKHQHLLLHSKDTDVLVLGSSHTYYGIQPELLSPKAYSAAQVSQTLRYDDYLLHHYPFPRLHWVVEPVSDFSLYEELEGTPNWFMANRYRIYMDCNIHPLGSVYDWEVTAFRSYCEKLKQLWLPPQMQWSSYGQGLEYTKERKSPHWDNGEQRALANRYSDLSHAPEGMNHLRNMARFCRKNHVRLLLVSTPLRRSYRQHQSPAQCADTQAYIRRLLHEFPEAIYLDFRSDPSFLADDFFDSDHLTRQGARKLTEALKQAMEKAQAKQSRRPTYEQIQIKRIL